MPGNPNTYIHRISRIDLYMFKRLLEFFSETAVNSLAFLDCSVSQKIIVSFFPLFFLNESPFSVCKAG